MTYFNLYEWRNRTGISPYSAAEKLGTLKTTYWIYEFFSICPKAIKLSCIYIELAYIVADKHIKYLKHKNPHHPCHEIARPYIVNGLLEGHNPTTESISILLPPKQRINFVRGR